MTFIDFNRFSKLIGSNPIKRIYEATHKSISTMVTPEVELGTFGFAPLIDFYQQGKPMYRIASEFGAELSKVRLSGLKAHHLQDTGAFICIEFPDTVNFTDRDGERIRAVYVAVVTKPGLVTESKDGIEDKQEVHKAYMAVYPFTSLDTDKRAVRFGTDIDCFYMQNEEEPLSTAIERANEMGSIKDDEKYATIRTYIINCLLYIQSGDPDLREYRAPRPPKTRDVKTQRIWARNHENLSKMDITLVGFNHLKRPEYTVDSTVVRAHARWQPCGTGRTKVKLIWIDAHERRYNKESPDAEA